LFLRVCLVWFVCWGADIRSGVGLVFY
jgi:hypothetical protein